MDNNALPQRFIEALDDYVKIVTTRQKNTAGPYVTQKKAEQLRARNFIRVFTAPTSYPWIR
ncbi:MAG TPA: hypothetical protein VL098_15535 [Flavipsychrobacter sp.]|nr:hypothetical protein [Flavipsychrobacter sp.]